MLDCICSTMGCDMLDRLPKAVAPFPACCW